jgi:hypothetical protein
MIARRRRFLLGFPLATGFIIQDYSHPQPSPLGEAEDEGFFYNVGADASLIPFQNRMLIASLR